MTAIMPPAVKLRDPFPPHRVLGEAQVSGLRYGFAIGETAPIQFDVSRADPNNGELFKEGAMLSIERQDRAHLYVGFIADAIDSLAGGTSALTVLDIFGSLFATGITSKGWPEQDASLGEMLRRVLGEAIQRAEPPLLVELPTTHGPRIAFTPAAHQLDDFMRTMSEFSDWEWLIDSELFGVGLRHRLISRRRLGRDLRSELTFEDGKHFTGAKLHRRASAYLKTAVAVGGSGIFGSRPAAQANAAGREELGTLPSAVGSAEPPASPALMGTGLNIDSSVTNQEALAANARRQHHSTDNVKHALSFTLYEAENADGLEAIDASKLELGSLYTAHYEDLALGKQYVRDVRLLGYSFDIQTAAIDCVAEVLEEAHVG